MVDAIQSCLVACTYLDNPCASDINNGDFVLSTTHVPYSVIVAKYLAIMENKVESCSEDLIKYIMNEIANRDSNTNTKDDNSYFWPVFFFIAIIILIVISIAFRTYFYRLVIVEWCRNCNLQCCCERCNCFKDKCNVMVWLICFLAEICLTFLLEQDIVYLIQKCDKIRECTPISIISIVSASFATLALELLVNGLVHCHCGKSNKTFFCYPKPSTISARNSENAHSCCHEFYRDTFCAFALEENKDNAERELVSRHTL